MEIFAATPENLGLDESLVCASSTEMPSAMTSRFAELVRRIAMPLPDDFSRAPMARAVAATHTRLSVG